MDNFFLVQASLEASDKTIKFKGINTGSVNMIEEELENFEISQTRATLFRILNKYF